MQLIKAELQFERSIPDPSNSDLWIHCYKLTFSNELQIIVWTSIDAINLLNLNTDKNIIIIAFNDNGNITKWGYHVGNYNEWVEFHLGKMHSIHSINVEGRSFSVNQEYEQGFISQLVYREVDRLWWANLKNKWGESILSLRVKDLENIYDHGTGERNKSQPTAVKAENNDTKH